MLKAADQGFVTFDTKKARENVENIRDEKQVESLDPKAADYDVPILKVEVVLAKQIAKRWVDAKGVGDKGSIRFGSMIRAGAEGHGKGKAIDINNLKMITSVAATIAVLNDLDKDVHSSYGLGMPFQGDFFDPADDLQTKKQAAESAAGSVATPEAKSDTPAAGAGAGATSTEKKETPATATVTDALKKFTSNVFQSTGTKGADNKWTWKDTVQEAGGAYKKLKSQALKDALASRRKEGFSFIIFLQIWIRLSFRVKELTERMLVECARRNPRFDGTPRGVDDLGPAAVVEGDVEEHASVARGSLLSVGELGHDVGGEIFEAADHIEANVVAEQRLQLGPQVALQQHHQRSHFGHWPLPVLDRKRVERQDMQTDAG